MAHPQTDQTLLADLKETRCPGIPLALRGAVMSTMALDAMSFPSPTPGDALKQDSRYLCSVQSVFFVRRLNFLKCWTPILVDN